MVEGRLQIRYYEKVGQNRRSADVVVQNVEFLGNNHSSSTTAPIASGGMTSALFGTEVFPEEEIPF